MTAQKTSTKLKLGIGIAALALSGGLGGSSGLMAAGITSVADQSLVRPIAISGPVVTITAPQSGQTIVGGFDFSVSVTSRDKLLLSGVVYFLVDGKTIAKQEVGGNPINALYQVPNGAIKAGRHTLNALFTTSSGKKYVANKIWVVVKPSPCGNGLVDSGEQCDDGNTEGGDGCSATCQEEAIVVAPSNLQIENIFDVQGLLHKLTWQDNSNDESQFEIERAITTLAEPPMFIPLDLVGQNVVTQSYHIAEPGKKYHYRVRACTATHVCSVYSNIAMIVVPGLGSFTLENATSTPNQIIAVTPNVWQEIWAPIPMAQGESILNFVSLHLENFVDPTAAADSRSSVFGLFDRDGFLVAQKSMTNGLVNFEMSTQYTVPIYQSDNGSSAFRVMAKFNPITDATKSGGTVRLSVNQESSGTNHGVNVQSNALRLPITDVTVTSGYSGVHVLRKSKPFVTPLSSESASLQSGSDKVIYRFTVRADAAGPIAWKGVKFDIAGRFSGADLATSSTSTAGFVTNGQDQYRTLSVSQFELYYYQTNQKVRNGAYSVSAGWDWANNNGELAIVFNDGIEEVVAVSQEYELRATINRVAQDEDYLDVRIDNQVDDVANNGNYYYGIITTDPDEVDGRNDGLITMLSQNAVGPYTFLWSDMSGAPHSAANDNGSPVSRDWTGDRLINVDTTSWHLEQTGF